MVGGTKVSSTFFCIVHGDSKKNRSARFQMPFALQAGEDLKTVQHGSHNRSSAFPGGLPLEISKFRRTVAPLVIVGLALGLFVLASHASAQVPCGTHLTQDLQSHPAFSGTLPNLLTTAGNDKYLYEATQYGFARASLANPSSPGPIQLLQIGQKC